MFHPISLLKAVGFGAGAMYLFDPQLGYRRRASLVESVTDAFATVNDVVESAAQGACDKAYEALEAGKDDAKNMVDHFADRMRPPKPIETFIRRTSAAIGLPKNQMFRATAGAFLVGHGFLSRSLLAKATGVVGFTMLASALEQSKLGDQVRLDHRDRAAESGPDAEHDISSSADEAATEQDSMSGGPTTQPAV